MKTIDQDERRRHTARAQCAMHAARLALARIAVTASAAPAPVGAQACWLARTQDGFMAWLAAGGFAQRGADAPADLESRNPATACER